MRLFGIESHDCLDGFVLRSHECPVCKSVQTDIVPLSKGEIRTSARSAHAEGFDDESLSLLGAVFDAAWKVLQDSGSSLAEEPARAGARRLLAQYILLMGRRCERDPQRLIEQALGGLTQSRSIDELSALRLSFD